VIVNPAMGIGPGDHLELELGGVTNAPAGAQTLQLSTSSDAAPVTLHYTLTP
jgi:hypothetical protein